MLRFQGSVSSRALHLVSGVQDWLGPASSLGPCLWDMCSSGYKVWCLQPSTRGPASHVRLWGLVSSIRGVYLVFWLWDWLKLGSGFYSGTSDRCPGVCCPALEKWLGTQYRFENPGCVSRIWHWQQMSVNLWSFTINVKRNPQIGVVVKMEIVFSAILYSVLYCDTALLWE